MKKALSIILVLIIMLSLLPAAFAAEGAFKAISSTLCTVQVPTDGTYYYWIDSEASKQIASSNKLLSITVEPESIKHTLHISDTQDSEADYSYDFYAADSVKVSKLDGIDKSYVIDMGKTNTAITGATIEMEYRVKDADKFTPILETDMPLTLSEGEYEFRIAGYQTVDENSQPVYFFPSTSKMVAVTESPDYLTLYKSVIDKYKAVADGRLQYDESVSDLCAHNKNIGYRLMDIDGNGISDLIIGNYLGKTGDDYPDHLVYDMYTLVDNTPVRILYSGARFRNNLLSNNQFYREWASSATEFGIDLLEYKNDEIKLIKRISQTEADQYKSLIQPLNLTRIIDYPALVIENNYTIYKSLESTLNLNRLILNKYPDNSEVTWSVEGDNGKYVTINNGVLIALSATPGEITLRATTTEGITDTCRLVINDITAVESVDIYDPSAAQYSLGSVGEVVRFRASVTPAWTAENNNEIRWSSSNDKVAKITAIEPHGTGAYIQASGAGSATITASCGGVSDVVSVVVISDYKFTSPTGKLIWYYDRNPQCNLEFSTSIPYQGIRKVIIQAGNRDYDFTGAAMQNTYGTVAMPYSTLYTTFGRQTTTMTVKVYYGPGANDYIYKNLYYRSIYDAPLTADTDMTWAYVTMLVSGLFISTSPWVIKRAKRSFTANR